MTGRAARRISILRSSIIGGLSAVALSVPANAAPPIIAGGYYTQTLSVECSASVCTLIFTKILAGHRLIATNLTCQLQTRNAPGNPHIFLGDVNSLSLHMIAPTFLGSFTADAATFRDFAANGEILHILLGDRFPRVTARTINSAGSIVSMTCSLGGFYN